MGSVSMHGLRKGYGTVVAFASLPDACRALQFGPGSAPMDGCRPDLT